MTRIGVVRRDSSSRCDGRGVSTVLDVALFLLLVSAAVGVLYAAPSPNSEPTATGGDDAAAVATTLASTTATVEYAPEQSGGGLRSAADPAGTATATAAGRLEDRNDSRRTDRGTVAVLLARATVERAATDARADASRSPYVRAVENETRQVLDAVEGGVQVRVRWEPLSGAEPAGQTTVGDAPPAAADVHAATIDVPVGSTRASTVAAQNASAGTTSATERRASPSALPPESARRAAAGANESLVDVANRSGCDGLAAEVAGRTVDTLFPPAPTGAALRADAATAGGVRDRYGAVGQTVGADPDDLPPEQDVRAANAALADELATDLEPIACEGYDRPVAAARAASPDTVTVVVRRWSP